MRTPLATAALIGAVSFAGLSFEVALTRLFSLILYQDFVFLGLSFAVLGMALGAVFCAILTNRGRAVSIGPLVSAYGLSMPVTFLLLTLLPSDNPLDLWLLFGACSMPPFILMGLINSRLYQSMPEKGGLLYAFDVVCAALGALASIFGMDLLGPFQYTLLLTLALSVVSAMVFGKKGVGAVAVGVCLFILGFSQTLRSTLDWAIMDRSVPGKALFDEIKSPGVSIERTKWTSMGRLDMVSRSDYPAKFFYTDAAVPATMFRFNDNKDETEAYLRRFVCFAPFTYGPCGKVLSIGTGGGMDCLLSGFGGAREVTAVEINGEMVRMAREEAAYNGGVFDLPGVKVVVDEGRSFVRGSREKYDIILLLLTQGNTAEAGGRVLTESYLLTKEAMGEYYDRLLPGGRLAVATHNPHRASRYLMTWAAMLSERGVDLSGSVRRFAMLSYPDAAYRFLCIFNREVVSPEDGARLKAFADSTPAEPIYIPFVLETDRDLGGMARGAVSAADFIRTSPNNINIAPVADNRPFQNDVYYGVHPGLKRLFYITLAFLAALLLLANFNGRPAGAGRGAMAAFSIYFALIGAAFMIAEVVFIRKMMLYLGRPALSLSVVLFSILLGAGLGGFLQQKLAVARKWIPLLAAALLLCLNLGLSEQLMDRLAPAPLLWRGPAVALLVMLPAFFMGAAFPAGLAALSLRMQNGTAWMWGINGAAAVTGSVAAMALSLSWGLEAALRFAACLYALAALLIWKLAPWNKTEV